MPLVSVRPMLPGKPGQGNLCKTCHQTLSSLGSAKQPHVCSCVKSHIAQAERKHEGKPKGPKRIHTAQLSLACSVPIHYLCLSQNSRPQNGTPKGVRVPTPKTHRFRIHVGSTGLTHFREWIAQNIIANNMIFPPKKSKSTYWRSEVCWHPGWRAISCFLLWMDKINFG